MRKEIKELQSEVEEWKEEYRFEKRQRIKAVNELREWKEMNNLIVQLKGTVGELQSLLRKGATAGREIRQDMEDVSEEEMRQQTISEPEAQEHQEEPGYTEEDPGPPVIPAKMRKSCGLADLLGQTYGDVGAPPKSLSAIAEEEVKRYQEVTPLALTEYPLSWWKAHEQVYPFLAKLAKRYLCIPGTSVSAETVFSTAGDIVTAQRSTQIMLIYEGPFRP
ncbi:hypothetical protein SKAU_G00062860 [Synaphobranchus kaupii]|uniref:HAT C-terminal dimerisation domain-containing protein n=1 Tax=Synaphobranchus kaupii TaxID=118154 RepID=A0A9Q1J9S3_SYNKA|nr:hypothetical protein SKAU_G00062860 [Synaphobranchus kaupii]